MDEFDVNMAMTANEDAVAAAVETAGLREALHLTMKTTLKKYPGCIHWHFKRGKEPGILEVTLWPADEENGAAGRSDRLWLSVHNNRKANWMGDLIPRLKLRIETELAERRG